MVGFLEGLKLTLRTARRRPVTAQYPEPEKRLPVQDRFMGFPALTWDYEVVEPYCTGCMVCVRNCPTQCMSAEMTDNPKAAEGTSSRRKIIDWFEINLGRCILCGICVDVCNFDAIEMSHEHELSKYERDGNRADLGRLLELGKEYQAEVNWKPTQPEKNSGVPKQRTERPAAADAGGKPSSEMTKEERLAAARARAAAKKQTQASGDAISETSPDATAKAKSDMTPEERLAGARARAAAKRQPQASEDAVAETPPDATTKAKSDMTPEERVAAARARAAAKKQTQASEDAISEAPPDATAKAKSDMTPEERVAAARARAAAKMQAQASGEDINDAEESSTEGVIE